MKFLSLEPLLGPLRKLNLRGIDWAIVGGESGPGARPLDSQWVTEIRDQCEQTRLWQILLETYGPEPLNRQFFAGSYLSGGQKKLFALTRCLLRNPTILFLDEPTTGMDSEEKLELVKIMRQACSGKTVLTVDHDLVGWQVLFCDHFVVLNEGKIEEQGTAAELLSRVGLFKSLFDDQAEGFHKMAAIIDAKTSSARPTPS